ncbi:alpha-L-fucosidase [Coraliomargarita algicola]|uniref:alpha-L-fucosidase n=1 Tax=Coraliomargarita algicola TaxID=3092156 RepID=A0ABZ0RHS9_9BACT|nr:alpha-L-fucosidase [Coraliomargarita sp. J2-16]WPJ95612.1 alpha-L-fucosidase [Coraliomargarita sp. J2-16]
MNASPLTKEDNLARFKHDRFGMFIHWGVYAMYATNEWCQYWSKLSDEEYQNMIQHFDPDMFEPKEWARIARECGMQYVVFTTKHHDGFCMWETEFTDYKITNTRIGRDVLREIVDAFRAEGLKVGLYYSISDWHHPDYIIDSSHSKRHLSPEEIRALNEGRTMARYAKYMRDQVRELLTNYGEIVEFWFDVSGQIDPVACESQAMLDMIRSLQPHILLNNRLSLPGSEDLLTPENYLRDADCVDAEGRSVTWEGCHNLSASWCYNRDEKSYSKSAFRCLEILITQTSLNGNSLMNIGPTARGYISSHERKILDVYAHWMKYHSRAIYGCGQAPKDIPPPPNDCRYTYHAGRNCLYLHFMRWPTQANVILHGLEGRIKYAQLLSDGSYIQTKTPPPGTNENMNPRFPPGSVSLQLMSEPEDVTIPVIEFFLN